MRAYISRAMIGWFVTDVADNGGATADRYTVGFRDGDLLSLSEQPSSPIGISQWGEGHVESNMTFEALPEDLQKHVLFRLNEAYADFIEDGLDRGETYRELMLEVVGYARGGRQLEIPENFEDLVVLNSPRVDRNVLEAAGQIPFSALEPSF